MTTADTVNDWARERLGCGAIAHAVDAYNQAFAALPDLIARLAPASADAAAPLEPAADASAAEDHDQPAG